MNSVVNVVIAGLGGQGVLKASDILADAALRAGYDVKKSEIHGMSQRGGSVTSDVRFGATVLSPMVPVGAAHFLVVLTADQLEPNRHYLATDGVLILPDKIDCQQLANRKSLNVAMLGLLSRHLSIPSAAWLEAIHHNLPDKLRETNLRAFQLGGGVISGVSGSAH